KLFLASFAIAICSVSFAQDVSSQKKDMKTHPQAKEANNKVADKNTHKEHKAGETTATETHKEKQNLTEAKPEEKGAHHQNHGHETTPVNQKATSQQVDKNNQQVSKD